MTLNNQWDLFAFSSPSLRFRPPVCADLANDGAETQKVLTRTLHRTIA